MTSEHKWAGSRIFLREMSESDIDDRYLSWFSDETVTLYLEARNLTLEDALSFHRRGRATGEHYQLAICDLQAGYMLGSVKIGPISKKHGVSDLVTIIGDRRYWGKGLASEAIDIANRVAFEKLGLRKLSGGIVAGNLGSIKCYTSAGWLVEGFLKAHYLTDGKPQDRVIVSCFNPGLFSEEDLKPLRDQTAEFLGSLGQRKAS